MPLFPDEDGCRLTKGAAIATIVEAARMTNELVQSETGAQQFGGHSLRTGGATLLARWGINPFRIQSMGRWRSNLVIHYSGSAMSHGITSEALGAQSQVVGNAAKHDAKHLARALADMEKRLSKAEAMEAQLEAKLNATQAESSKGPLTIRNEETRKVHRGIECRDDPSVSWTTPCGWKYSTALYSRHRRFPVDSSKKDVCGRCWPFERCTWTKDLISDDSD